jgi:hypothetical protein
MKTNEKLEPQRHRDTEKGKYKKVSVFSLCLCVSVVKGFS